MVGGQEKIMRKIQKKVSGVHGFSVDVLNDKIERLIQFQVYNVGSCS